MPKLITKAKLSKLSKGCHYIKVNGKKVRVKEINSNED